MRDPLEQAPGPTAAEDPKEHSLKSLFVRGEYTIIPLPAFAYNRNEKYWIGTLVPMLKANERGNLEQIFAPLYLFNPLVGSTITGNYYRYKTDMETYSVVASYSERIERYFEGSYKNLAAAGGRYILALYGNWFKNAFARFFGFGTRSREQNETNYTSREGNMKLTAGINLTPDLSVVVTERYRDVRVEQGIVGSLPSTRQVFPNLPGIEGAQILGHQLTIFYDSRDNQLTPSRGSYLNLSGAFNQDLKTAENVWWWRFTIDGRHLIPHDGNKVFVAHLLLDAVNRANRAEHAIPFYERPTLGGENSLRAFGLQRFIGNTAALVNLEERILLVERKFFDYAVDLEVAPFVDIGRVSTKLNFPGGDLANLQVNPGTGIRVRAKPNVVGRLDVAYGKDGGNVFVGLDYPF